MGGLFNELSSTVFAFEALFAVVDATVLDRSSGCTNGAARDGGKTANTSMSLSLHFEHYLILLLEEYLALTSSASIVMTSAARTYEFW